MDDENQLRKSLREVPLAAFDDPSWCWNVKLLSEISPEGLFGAEAMERELDSITGEDSAGAFELSFGSFSRQVFWRYSAQLRSIDMLDIPTVAKDLSCDALRIKLPNGFHVAKDGITLFRHRTGTVMLCIALVEGKGICCRFRGPSNNVRGTVPFWSIDGNRGTMLDRVDVEEFSTLGADIKTACWFVDAKDVVYLAAAPSDFSSGAFADSRDSQSSVISCLSFSAERGEVQLNDTSLVQRLWTGLLKRPTKSSTSGSSVNQSIVLLKAVTRGDTQYDDTFLIAVYNDGKIRLWSLSQRSCRSEADLFQLYANSTATSENYGSVEKAWLEPVVRNETTEHLFSTLQRNKSLVTIVALHLSTAKPIIMMLYGSLTTNQISLDTTCTDLALPSNVVRGFRLTQLFLDDRYVRSVWWKPMNGKSTLALSHDLFELSQGGSEPFSAAAISLDFDRSEFLQKDMGADSDEAFIHRMKIPGRFSIQDVRNGLSSCFGVNVDLKRQLGVDSVFDLESTNSTTARHHKTSPTKWTQVRDAVLDLARSFVHKHVQQILNKDKTTSSATAEELRITVWRRLIQDCEDAWLRGHEPLFIGKTCLHAEFAVIRSQRTTAFRHVEPVETALLQVHGRPTDPLHEATRGFAPWVNELLESTCDLCDSPFAQGEDALLNQIDTILDATVDFSSLAQVVDTFVSRFSDAKELVHYLEMESEKLFQGGQLQQTNLPKERTEKVEKIHPLLVLMSIYSLEQGISARLSVLCTVLFIWRALVNGVPSQRKFFRLSNGDSKTGLSAIAKRCSVLFTLSWLGDLPPLEVPQSLDWIRQPSKEKKTTDPLRTASRSLSGSVLSHYIDEVFSTDSRGSSFLTDHSGLLGICCDLVENMLPFLDKQQQYRALAQVAFVCDHLELGFDESSLESDDDDFMEGAEEKNDVLITQESLYCHEQDRSRYFAFLQGKSCLWNAASVSSEGIGEVVAKSEKHRWVNKAIGFFQAATPRFTKSNSNNVLAYYLILMELFANAKAGQAALNFVLKGSKLAIKDPAKMSPIFTNIYTKALKVEDYKQAFATSHLVLQLEDKEANLNGTRMICEIIKQMVDNGKVFELCELPLQTCSFETWTRVMRTLETKAASTASLVDLTKDQSLPNNYQIAYSFCMFHSRYSKAAEFMYDMANRIQREVRQRCNDEWTFELMHRVQFALQTCFSTLQLVPEEKRKIFLNPARRPQFFWDEESDVDYEMDTSNFDEASEDRRGAIEVSSDQIYKMYYTSRCATDLLRKTGAKLPTWRLRPNTFVLDLVYHDETDSAAQFAQVFDMDASAMFHLLAQRAMSGPVDGPRWKKVHQYLRDLDFTTMDEKKEAAKLQSYKYHSVVLETFLSQSKTASIPNWLVQSFLFWGGTEKNEDPVHVFFQGAPKDNARNPALLFQILIKHGRVDEAFSLACLLLSTLANQLGNPDNLKEAQANPPLIPFQTLEVVYSRANMAGLDVKELESEIVRVAECLSNSNPALYRNL